MADPEKANAGLYAIVVYKTAKAMLQLGFALLACALLPFGLPDWIRQFASALRQHFTHGWATSLAGLLERGSTGHGIEFGILALGLDGGLTAVEAWALRSGRWWGPWLVVLATSSLLPFELYEFARSPHLSRAVWIALNLLIVAYLAWRARREHAPRPAPEE